MQGGATGAEESYPGRPVKKELVNHLPEDAGCIATTRVDYYGRPPLVKGLGPAV